MNQLTKPPREKSLTIKNAIATSPTFAAAVAIWEKEDSFEENHRDDHMEYGRGTRWEAQDEN